VPTLSQRIDTIDTVVTEECCCKTCISKGETRGIHHTEIELWITLPCVRKKGLGQVNANWLVSTVNETNGRATSATSQIEDRRWWLRKKFLYQRDFERA
jgi:hypothetical protein